MRIGVGIVKPDLCFKVIPKHVTETPNQQVMMSNSTVDHEKKVA